MSRHPQARRWPRQPRKDDPDAEPARAARNPGVTQRDMLTAMLAAHPMGATWFVLFNLINADCRARGLKPPAAASVRALLYALEREGLAEKDGRAWRLVGTP